QADVPVQMRPGGTPGGAHFADHLATTDLLALLHIELGQMAVHGDQALPMIYEYRLAIEEIVGHDGHDAIGGRLDRCAGRHGEVQARMRVAFFAVEEAPQTKATGQTAFHRLVQHNGRRPLFAEAAICSDLRLVFALKSLQLFGIRVYMALVLQLDVLRFVIFGADLESQLRWAVWSLYAQVLGSCRGLQI